MKKLRQNVISTHQKKGQAWLEALPDFLKNIEKKRSITLGEPFKNLSYNYTAVATMQDGKSVVFKCGVPNKALTTEIAALKHYDGHGAVQLLDANAEEGWLLLERCEPGETLQIIESDADVIKILVHTLQRLWKPIKNDAPFPTLEDWFKKLIPNERIPNKLMDFAKSTSKALLDSQGERVLLHGDLHLENALSAKREPWLAIDPKGVIGEREFDLVGTLLQTLDPSKLSKKMIQQRADQVSKLTGFDKQRVILWSAVKCVLGACWCIEDRVDGAENFVELAEILS